LRTISAIAALILVAGSCVAFKPGSTGYSATWLSVLGVSGVAGPTDYLHFWNPASLDETDQGPGGNDATSVNFNPDSADGWNMGTDNNKYVLLDGPKKGRTNNLRVGEGILLGLETVNRTPIEGTRQDAFVLEAELVEVSDDDLI